MSLKSRRNEQKSTGIELVP
jgi:hypothetical protein